MKISLPISTRFAIRSFPGTREDHCFPSWASLWGARLRWSTSRWCKGKIDLFVRNIAEGGVGHFRVAPKGWEISHDSSLRLADWKSELAELRRTRGVHAATPRARVQAMLAMGTHMVGTEIVGVDPETEPATYRYVRQIASGRYLRAGDSHEMVVGKAIADRLKVDVGDSIFVTVVDHTGTMKSEMFDVLGIVNLGSQAMEMTLCQTNLKDIETLSGLPGAGEIAVVLDKPDLLESVMDKIRPTLTSTDVLLSWAQNPGPIAALRSLSTRGWPRFSP